MKKVILLLIISFYIIGVKAQQTDRLTFATTVGTGIAMSKPAPTPFTWQVLGYYNINKRFSIGVGSGVSVYEKVLIPLFADAKFTIIKPKKFTPYLECTAGYSFAPDKNANGGFYLNPSVGVQYAYFGDKKLFLALGYELQEFKQLKRKEQSLFTAEFVESLNHNFISIKLGLTF